MQTRPSLKHVFRGLVLGVAFILLLTRWPIKTESAQAISSPLEGLRVVGIVVESTSEAAIQDGITRAVLQDQALIYLRAKALRLRIDPIALPYIYINLNHIAREATFASSLEVAIFRPVEILVGVDYGSEQPRKRVRTGAQVWGKAFVMRGSRESALPNTRETLELLLESFVAEYYKANP